MTYLDVVFNYGSLPGENELRAIDTMREVYGIRSVRFDNHRRTVRVEFDASRMKQDAVAKLLRSAGIDVREPVALAYKRLDHRCGLEPKGSLGGFLRRG